MIFEDIAAHGVVPVIALDDAAAAIEAATGMKAYTEEKFFWATIWWYFKNTGIPIAFISTGYKSSFFGVTY